MNPTPPNFAAPGPGCWELDAVHFTRPVTRLFAEFFPRSFTAGFRASARTYGSLLDTLEFSPTNGVMYFAPRAVAAPKDAKGPPPKPVFKLLLWLHPELRRRQANARKTLSTRRWREDLRLWDEQLKPAAIRTHRALQSVDLTALGSEALRDHLRSCRDHWSRMVEQHHRFDFPALVPVGDYITQVAEWTGLDPMRLCALLRGASDVSSGGSPELARLRAALHANPQAARRIEAGAPAEAILKELAETPGEVGAAARDWLSLVSYRLQNGLDISERTNRESPELLVTSVRRLLEPESKTDHAAEAAAIADRVPAAHRREFETLLEEARLVYRLRDERGLYSDIWAAGILRHALLEAGRRLTQAGRLESPELMLEAGSDEIEALLGGDAAPTSETLSARAQYRLGTSALSAPLRLGPTPAGPPPLSWLPPASARMERSIGIAIAGIFGESSAKSEAGRVRGLGVSSGTIEGTARVVLDASGFERLQKGDILVTRSTTAAFNVVLPLLSGIVTDRGGALSHSAIVAREYGIPAVVGSRDATRLIADGVRILINGDLGEVQLL